MFISKNSCFFDFVHGTYCNSTVILQFVGLWHKILIKCTEVFWFNTQFLNVQVLWIPLWHVGLISRWIHNVLSVQLEVFLTQRVTEMGEESDVVAMSQFQMAPSVIQNQTREHIRDLLSQVQDLLGRLTSLRMQHLFMIQASPRYGDRHSINIRNKKHSSFDSLIKEWFQKKENCQFLISGWLIYSFIRGFLIKCPKFQHSHLRATFFSLFGCDTIIHIWDTKMIT